MWHASYHCFFHSLYLWLQWLQVHVFGNYWLGELKDRDPQAISAGQHGPRPRFLPHGHQLISASATSIQLHVLIPISIQLRLLILISIHLYVLILIGVHPNSHKHFIPYMGFCASIWDSVSSLSSSSSSSSWSSKVKVWTHSFRANLN